MAGSSRLESNARLQLLQLLFKKDLYPGPRLLAEFGFSRVIAQRSQLLCSGWLGVPHGSSGSSHMTSP